MKAFKVPGPISPKVPGKDQLFHNPDGSLVTVSFRDFCETSILSDPRWIRSFADVKAAMALSAQLGSELISLEDADYTRLKECVEHPTNGFQGYHPTVIPQFFPFLKAILEAS